MYIYKPTNYIREEMIVHSTEIINKTHTIEGFQLQTFFCYVTIRNKTDNNQFCDRLLVAKTSEITEAENLMNTSYPLNSTKIMDIDSINKNRCFFVK
jgi:hypothetical protein